MPSMEAMPEKRRRLSLAASEQDLFDQLPDSVAEEILLRLPFSSVFSFRCVSKSYLSLTTSPHFIRRFERHHASVDSVPPLMLLLQNPETRTFREFFVCAREPEFKFFRFSLDFIPRACMDGDDEFRRIPVEGLCDDLLLCSNRVSFQSEYFIVNPITRQWVALPPPLQLHKSVLTGFVCDPASISEARKGGKLQYRVVRVPIFNDPETKVEIFSSEDGRWTDYMVPWPAGRVTIWKNTSAVACNRRLYWQFQSDRGKMLGLDPFNPMKIKIQIIQDPAGNILRIRKEDNLGICRGKLTLCRSSWSRNGFYDPPSDVTIWELTESNDKAEWRLVHTVSLEETVAAAEIFGPLSAVLRGSWTTLGVHPGAGDIVYFGCSPANSVICCNLKKMRLEVVAGNEDLDFSFDNWGAALRFMLPCWPTPVPALTNL